MRWHGQLLLCLVLFLGWLWPLQRVVGAQESVATPALSAVSLTPNDCAFLIQGTDDPRARLGDITCGTLDVPENWTDPAGRHIQIGYLVLRSTGSQHMPDPVVFLAGGPGSSPLTSGEVWARFFAGLRQERDVVFFDQRGTRLSSPLRCDGLTSLMALALPPEVDASAGTPEAPRYPADITNPDDLLQDARERYGPAGEACAQQLVEAGVDLTQYTSIASANDVVALVKALGYDEYNLYGISYGTRLALEVMRNHPQSGLRSVVLDSTYPPEIPTYEQLAVSTHEVALRLFADCAHDDGCNAAYPDLEQRFISLLAHLRTTPVVSDDGTPITDRDLINVMHSLTSRVEIVPYVPLLIAELERGEDETYRGITSGSLFVTGEDSRPNPATPELEAVPESDSAVALHDISAARSFVANLQAQLERSPELAADGAVQSLIELDAMAHDRQALQAFVDRTFSLPEQRGVHDALASTLEEMSDAEIEEVFTVVEQAVTLEDSRIAGQMVAQYYSIECNERLPFQSFAQVVANAQRLDIPELALGKPEALAKVFAICENWPSGQAPAVEHERVASEVPTLILSGAYDNLTPVTWNKSAFVTLPNAVFLLTPMSGHAVMTYSPCAEQLGQDFIANPVAPLDTHCLTGLAPQWVFAPSEGQMPEQAATPQPEAMGTAPDGAADLLPRESLLPLAVVQEVIPAITRELTTGPNATVMGAPVANRSVTFATADGSQHIVLSVDEYRTAQEAEDAFHAALEASKAVPGVTTEEVAGLGDAALLGVVTQGDETHVGGGALFDNLIVNATLQSFAGSDENKERVKELIRRQAGYVKIDSGANALATPVG